MIRLTKNIKYLMCGGVTIATLAGAIPAQAASFISTVRDGSNGLGNSHVGTLNPATGVYSDFITTEIELTDIAVNSGGVLYGMTYDHLYKLNPGIQTQESVGALRVASTIDMNGLGFDTNDNLFATGNNGFYQLNTTDGAARLINTIANFSSIGDLVFNPYTNRFFATSQIGTNNSILFSIDLNGAGTQIGDIGFKDVYGLTFEGFNLVGYTTDRQQINIDITNGTGVFDKNLTGVPSYVNPVDGSTLLLTGSASSPTKIPEPSFTAGFVVLGACFGVRYSIQRRRNQKAIES